MDDRELLHQYVAGHSEHAFAELVARHLPFVLATALRLAPEPQAAADVAQTVFIELARKAGPSVRSRCSPAGSTRHAPPCAQCPAGRTAPLQRETLAMKFAETETAADHAWENLAPWWTRPCTSSNAANRTPCSCVFLRIKATAKSGASSISMKKPPASALNRALEKMRRHFFPPRRDDHRRPPRRRPQRPRRHRRARGNSGNGGGRLAHWRRAARPSPVPSSRLFI